jgi:lipoate-protein ligase A
MKKNRIDFVRRQSGGGTVYHDKGNINFSIIADKNIHDKDWNHDVIVRCLSELKVNTHATKRGDIRFIENDDRKFSGSAFKEKKLSAFHHGTLLIDSDLNNLNNYIHSNKQNLESKSISSVRSIVGNLSEKNPKLTTGNVSSALCDFFLKESNIDKKVYIDVNSEISKMILKSDYYEKLKSLSWRYEETPKFFVNTNYKNWSIELTIKKTKVIEVVLENFEIHPSFLLELDKSLIGISIIGIRDYILSLEYFLNYAEELKDLVIWFEDYFNLNFLP